MLVSHVLVPPAMDAVLASPTNRVQGFLAPGHVATIMGCEPYDELVKKYRAPIVVTGFEPVDLLEGIDLAVKLLEDKRWEVENQYARSVRRTGNERAREVITEVYEICDQAWRGIGVIPRSGLKLNAAYADFDAEIRFDLKQIRSEESTSCRAGEVLQGLIRPDECPAFGTSCDPDHPLGAPMVSSEGACSAYWRYARK
jgi:hydrogenase expression/formation protein HypD